MGMTDKDYAKLALQFSNNEIAQAAGIAEGRTLLSTEHTSGIGATGLNSSDQISFGVFAELMCDRIIRLEFNGKKISTIPNASDALNGGVIQDYYLLHTKNLEDIAGIGQMAAKAEDGPHKKIGKKIK